MMRPFVRILEWRGAVINFRCIIGQADGRTEAPEARGDARGHAYDCHAFWWQGPTLELVGIG